MTFSPTYQVIGDDKHVIIEFRVELFQDIKCGEYITGCGPMKRNDEVWTELDVLYTNNAEAWNLIKARIQIDCPSLV